MINNILLTIAIPTYNREHLLKKCLSSLIASTDKYRDIIQIIVSDNASSDNTKLVIEECANSMENFVHIENAKNLGPDFNISQCYLRALGKYVWIFSDDDFLLPTYLDNIINLLKSSDIGVLHLSSLWYSQENIPIIPVEKFLYQEFDSPIDFLNNIHYWVTFITSNIVNKDLVSNNNLINEFNKTSLVQLGWVMPAIFNGKKNIFVNTKVLACKANNTGGYKLLEVFGKNFNFIINVLIKKGYDRRMKSIINDNLLNSFFPMFINKENKDLVGKKALFTLLPVYWKYKMFWIKIFPSLVKYQLGAK